MELIARRTDNDRVRKLADTALQAAMRGAQLTSQLLAFSRRQELHPTVVDLTAVITETELLLRRFIGETVNLTIEANPSSWPVRVDGAQFQAAVMNLVVNARDAMPDGGRIRLSLRRTHRSIGIQRPQTFRVGTTWFSRSPIRAKG